MSDSELNQRVLPLIQGEDRWGQDVSIFTRRLLRHVHSSQMKPIRNLSVLLQSLLVKWGNHEKLKSLLFHRISFAFLLDHRGI